MTNLPDLNQREILVLKNFLRILISENIEIITISQLLEFPDRMGLPLPFIRPVLISLIAKKILNTVQFNNLQHIGLNSEHVDWFYDLAATLGLVVEDKTTSGKALLDDRPNNIPAGNRFVSLLDNQNEVSQAITALDQLSDAISKTNDPLTANPEDRVLLSKQVNLLNELISQPRIQLAALYDIVYHNSTLKWLAEQAISGVVRQAAVMALKHLGSLLQSLLK